MALSMLAAALEDRSAPNRAAKTACKPSTCRSGLNLRMERALNPDLISAAEIVSGQLADFDALVALHRPRIFRFIYASLRDRETAENLTQDCFIRAYKARQGFRGDASVTTWLMQIAANLVRNHEASGRLKFWRRNSRETASAADLRDWIPDPKMSPEEAAAAREIVTAIWKAAGQLSGRQRTVFLLRYGEDLNLSEIASITGMKEGTIKTHLFRAVQAIRASLEA